ncbi:hypothetical protein E2C01_080746 [Portunus trituberculatus]|uniref:Uncharacterized protein n=1 Tax=Portunus trituberculatus TaxID=210409 RepID=A0A5B7IMY7_PORTR|nr:hypothetical protein [Portunus trituberculatus]
MALGERKVWRLVLIGRGAARGSRQPISAKDLPLDPGS